MVSIQLGLEDFASDDRRRIISAARNLYSGVLLLCKEVLRRLSPPNSNEILIRTKKKAVRNPKGKIKLVGDGNKTIDRQEIEDIFKQLQLAADLSKLRRLAEIRNDIEHMHPKHAPSLIQEAIADAMPIIRDVVVKELHEEPSVLLGKAAWVALLDQAAVFKVELDACTASFDQIDWESATLAKALKDFRCPQCSSTLLRNDNDSAKEPVEIHLVCSKCGEDADLEDVIEAGLKESLWIEEHISIKDGGDPLLASCPECSRETYVRYEDQCVNPGCGFSLNGVECALCSADLTLDDYSYGNGRTCSYCEHVMSKDD